MPLRSTLVALALLLVPAAARATLVVPLDVDQLSDQAERIAVARVESQVSRFTSNHGAIYTEVTLRVLRAVKGPIQEGELVTVRREGGVVDKLGMKVIGAAHFDTGEEVLVFLEKRGVALWTVGMAQGKMRVETRAAGKVAIRNHAGLGYLTAPRPEPTERPLDELLGQIAARVGGRR